VTFKYLKYNNGNLETAGKTQSSSDGVMLTGRSAYTEVGVESMKSPYTDNLAHTT